MITSGKPMTVADLCRHNDISVATAEAALDNLQAKGLVTGFVAGDPDSHITFTENGAALAQDVCDTPRKQRQPCSRCGELEGWYEKRVSKYLQFFDADGQSCYAGNMERVSGGTRCYCTSCHKDITDQL
jgi:hypothetical protein